jgi:hypothetical protein
VKAFCGPADGDVHLAAIRGHQSAARPWVTAGRTKEPQTWKQTTIRAEKSFANRGLFRKTSNRPKNRLRLSPRKRGRAKQIPSQSSRCDSEISARSFRRRSWDGCCRAPESEFPFGVGSDRIGDAEVMEPGPVGCSAARAGPMHRSPRPVRAQCRSSA